MGTLLLTISEVSLQWSHSNMSFDSLTGTDNTSNPTNPNNVVKRRSSRVEDARNLRPSNREEMAVLQEALTPTRRAYIKLCGQFTPTALLSESYATQLAIIQKSFEKTWTESYKDVIPPQLPALSAWKGNILALSGSACKQRSTSVIRRFDIQARGELEAIVQRLRDKGQGPFWEAGNDTPAIRAGNRRVQGANAHCLNNRDAVFENRPSFACASDAQKWCLARLHYYWDLKRKDPNGSTGTVAPRALEDPTAAAIMFVERVLDERDEEFFAWLRTTGIRVLGAHWKQIDVKEFNEWIAPIAFASAVYSTFPDSPEKDAFDNPGADDPAPVTNHSRVFDTASFSQSQAIRGSDVFMGAEGGLKNFRER